MGDYEERQGAFVHKTANLVGDRIRIGAGSRIDAFVTITGDVTLGRMVHVGGSACLIGGGGITIGDYSGVSPGVKIFTTSESLDGEWMIHPTVPEQYRRPIVKPVSIGAHCTVGANSVLLPGAIMDDGACLGALSLTKGQLGEWSIWAGVPARFIRTRGRRSIELARELEQQ